MASTDVSTTETLVTETIPTANYSNSTVQSDVTLSTGWEILLQLLYGLIGGSGILGNGLVCFVFITKRKSFSSITNLLILNQSLIDLGDSILFLAIRFGHVAPSDDVTVWGEIVCRLWISEYFMWSLFIASTVNLVFVSLERYLAICHPVKHRNVFTKRLAKFGMTLVWIIGLTYQAYWPSIQYYAEGVCYPLWPSVVLQRIMGVVLFLCEFLIPLTIMTFSYVSIILALRGRSNGKTNNTFQQAKKNVTTTLCLVFMSYVICWTPTEFTFLLFNLGRDYDFTSTTHKVVTVMVMCNMCVNPFIYAFKYDLFKKHAKRMFCRCCRDNKVETENSLATVDANVGSSHPQ
ncbi:galanin receptor 2a-like [Patiria miniata]|uniref:G-protein coupled receptors family 1 profile domain-containing protein n=1 Tax=Patiria miniata TaxID=46514 RepID=A0A914AI78_PATMI|nr:galanin receptor 2a-like [Patiria miniata]